MPPTKSPELPFAELKEKIELFLCDYARPVLTEPGKEVMDLTASSYSLSVQHNRLLWHIWNEHANVVRQITALRREAPGKLELRYQRFGKGPPGTLILADSRARPETLDRKTRRMVFTRTLRRVLAQLFPHSKMEGLTCEPDLAHSLSGKYSRGLLRLGSNLWALIGAGEEEDPATCDGILTYGLLWLHHLREQHLTQPIAGLKIFLPAGRADTTAQRLAWLDPAFARCELYELGQDLRPRDLSDAGNLRTSLRQFHSVAPHASHSPELERLSALHSAVDVHYGPDGLAKWSLRGLTFARETPGGVVFGLGRAETRLEPATFPELESLVQRIGNHRSADAPDRDHPLYRLHPERWLQSLLRRQPAALGFSLLPDPVYEQVLSLSGLERGIMDLLAVTAQGRLVIVELKASEEIHLPLQALDYWLRVRWHQQRGDLERHGYFLPRQLSSQPPSQLNDASPLLLLVSPALQFHSSCETILRYISPQVEIVRVGLNETWREGLQVVFREGRAGART